MLIAHRIALDPNNAQASYFARACGVARFAYNWALAEWQRQYEAWKADNSRPKPSQAALRRQLNTIKREQFPWMLEVTKCAPQMAIIQLGEAFKNFAGNALDGRGHQRAEASQGAAVPPTTALAQPEPQAERFGQPQEGRGRSLLCQQQDVLGVRA